MRFENIYATLAHPEVLDAETIDGASSTAFADPPASAVVEPQSTGVATDPSSISIQVTGLDDELGQSIGLSGQAHGRTTFDGIPLAQILHDRPDVLQAFFTEYDGPNNDHHSSAWVDRVGGITPEDYANYWYETYGQYGGYTPASAAASGDEPRASGIADPSGGASTTIDPARILLDRPDVFRAFYSEYYGPNNDHHSSAWMDRVGGDTPEAYALYWYNMHGKYEGYTQSSALSAPDPDHFAALANIVSTGRTTDDGIPLEQILKDRPDVYRAFFTEYYGPNNDHHSSAWMNRVGGATPEDYANYWYKTYGRYSGYVPSNAHAAPAEGEASGDAIASPATTVVADDGDTASNIEAAGADASSQDAAPDGGDLAPAPSLVEQAPFEETASAVTTSPEGEVARDYGWEEPAIVVVGHLYPDGVQIFLA